MGSAPSEIFLAPLDDFPRSRFATQGLLDGISIRLASAKLRGVMLPKLLVRACGPMAILYYDPIVLEHDTGRHPECAARILPSVRKLNDFALRQHCERPSWKPISREQLELVHPPHYIDSIERSCLSGGARLDPDTVVSENSYRAATISAGAVADAVTRVLTTDENRAFCLIRPPGHHALADRAMGFCLFNNVAVGARTATSQFGLDRVLIVDWDVHHGNGTQDLFWEDPQIGFFSIHRYPFYPGTGAADETGGGKGAGATLNEPVEYGASRTEFLGRFSRGLEKIAKKMRPQLLLISAGFDAHRLDPIGSLGLESEDFATMTTSVLEIAKVYAEGQVVSVLEGGYHPDAVGESVDAHLHALIQP